MFNFCLFFSSRKKSFYFFFVGGGGAFLLEFPNTWLIHVARILQAYVKFITSLASLACLGDEPFRFRARGSEQIPSKFVELLQNKKLYQ